MTGLDGAGQAGQQPPWWAALPPAEMEITCGQARHTIRWADGELVLPAHPDAEAELILGALGGDKCECTELAAVWRRHHDDLALLALGPRSAADEIGITWDEISTVSSGKWAFGLQGPAVSARDVRRALTTTGLAYSPLTGQWAAPPGGVPESGRLELLTLLALGPAFGMRLAATVAAAWSGAARAADRAANRPALTAALAGRFALAAGAWAGMEAGQLTASLHEGPGWGSLEHTGQAASGPASSYPEGGPANGAYPDAGRPEGGWLDGKFQRGGLRASLPLAWLAQVWAAGLTVVEGHLVLAVQAARWPAAEVLALRGLGGTPVTLQVRAADPAAGDAARSGGSRWQVAG